MNIIFDDEISKIRVLNNKILLIFELLNFADFSWTFAYFLNYLLPAPSPLLNRVHLGRDPEGRGQPPRAEGQRARQVRPGHTCPQGIRTTISFNLFEFNFISIKIYNIELKTYIKLFMLCII